MDCFGRGCRLVGVWFLVIADKLVCLRDGYGLFPDFRVFGVGRDIG